MTTASPAFRLVLASAAAATTLLAGCGGPAGTVSEGGSSGSVGTSTSGATSVNPTDMTNPQQAPQRLVIDVTIKGGQVTPTNQTLQAKVKQPIVIRVVSDVPDELHVHSVPDHTFKIEPKEGQANQAFQFTVDVPGQVAVELHELDKTIATIQVQQ
jgi:hypothetical protein